jgi:ribosomal protein L7Ae-like RNA K-turn-binding protein
MTDLLGLLGLGLKAGNLIVGVDAVRNGLQRGRCVLVVVAADAGPRTVEKVVRLARAREVPCLTGPLSAPLGMGLGRPPVMAVGVRDPALARGLLAAHREMGDGGVSGQDESPGSR